MPTLPGRLFSSLHGPVQRPRQSNRHSTACPWNLSSGTPEASCCYCSAGSKVRERSGIGGLTSQLLLLRAVRLVTSADNARHAASRHRPLHVATAHFRSRTRARTAAAIGVLRPFGQLLLRCQRGFPPVFGGGWLRKARENVPSLRYTEEGGHPSSYAPAARSGAACGALPLKDS